MMMRGNRNPRNCRKRRFPRRRCFLFFAINVMQTVVYQSLSNVTIVHRVRMTTSRVTSSPLHIASFHSQHVLSLQSAVLPFVQWDVVSVVEAARIRSSQDVGGESGAYPSFGGVIGIICQARMANRARLRWEVPVLHWCVME